MYRKPGFREHPIGRRCVVFTSGVVFFVFSLSLGAWGSSASGAGRLRPPCPTGNNCVYVLNQTGIVPFGLLRDRFGESIRPPSPFMIDWNGALAVTPNGRTAYAWFIGYGLRPIDLETGVVGSPLHVEAGEGGIHDGFVLGPSGHVLYLDATTGSNQHASVEEINVRTNRIEGKIRLPSDSGILAIAPDGRTAYVWTNYGADITSLDLASGSIGNTISVPEGVGSLAISANGELAYAAGTTNIGIGDGHTYSFITPIDLVTGKALTPIRLDHAPTSLVLAPNGLTAYVTVSGSNTPPARPAVMVLNLVTDKVTKSIRLPAGALAIAMANRPRRESQPRRP
jgi:DNA-binding beta-propeller fold protein YncE